MKSDEITIFEQSVSESDIDWLLCLQINTNSQFQKWLASKLFGLTGEHVGAWRSVSEQSGESDLIWIVEKDNLQRVMALIENKINAAAQPQQHERYRERGELYKAEGKCEDFVIALCAPEKYSSADSEQYKVKITYESIRDWFKENDRNDLSYFSFLMERAITKSKEIKPPDQEISLFQKQIWDIASKEFPEISLNEPSPGREYWVTQSYGDYAIRYKMLKKYDQVVLCVVDLELPGRGDDMENMRESLGEELDELGADITRTGKSAAIRFEVPIVVPPHFDEENVREALEKWSKLLTWWRVRKYV